MIQTFRRLQRIHLQIRLCGPLFRHCPSSQPSFHQPLYQPFYRTFLIPCQNSLLQSLRFSTLKHFQTLSDSLEFRPENARNYDIRDSAVFRYLGALQQVSHLPTEAEAISALEDSEIEAGPDVVRSAIWALREESRLAFLAFNWGEKLGSCDEEAWYLMIWVLANNGKFNTAWCLIRDLHRSSMNTRRAMLIMIDRYAFANDPGKAIWTFQVMEKFNLSPDQEAFHVALNALCRHGYIEEAEEFMVKSKKLFPLETEGFNIILNGWCNISVDVFEAKRVWREMSKCCLTPNEVSYTHMISCFSKVGNLFESLRLYDGMKKRGWIPGIEVYNSLISVSSKKNCFKEALKFLQKMKESGLKPDSITYNVIIHPLCKVGKLDEARSMLDAMIGENISPTIETYHAFLESSDFEETLEVVSQMKKSSLGPNKKTFHAILEKFFRLKQPENALKIWAEMKHFEVAPDSSHYSEMVQGLVTSGLLIKAREIFAAMKSDGFVEDPKLKMLLKKPVRHRTGQKEWQARQRERHKVVKHRQGNHPQSRKKKTFF